MVQTKLFAKFYKQLIIPGIIPFSIAVLLFFAVCRFISNFSSHRGILCSPVAPPRKPDKKGGGCQTEIDLLACIAREGMKKKAQPAAEREEKNKGAAGSLFASSR